MKQVFRKSRMLTTVAVLSATGVLAFPVLASTAQAATGGCRSDPVFTLSNGKTITLNETISDTKADVVGASYVLHIPVGAKVKTISYSGAVGNQQSVAWYADETGSALDTYTTVLTKTSKVAVVAYLSVGAKNSTSTSGLSAQALHNTLSA